MNINFSVIQESYQKKCEENEQKIDLLKKKISFLEKENSALKLDLKQNQNKIKEYIHKGVRNDGVGNDDDVVMMTYNPSVHTNMHINAQPDAINQNTANPFATNPFSNVNNTNNSSNIGNIGNNNLPGNISNNNTLANFNNSIGTNMMYTSASNASHNTQISHNYPQNINSNQGANTNRYKNQYYNFSHQQDNKTQSFSSTVQGQGATNGYVNKPIDDINPFKNSTATNPSSSNLLIIYRN